jgi:hypothetical protein
MTHATPNVIVGFRDSSDLLADPAALQARAASDRGPTVMARPLRAMSRQAAVESSS